MGIAHLFSEHAHGFEALAGKASAFHEQFAQNSRTCAAAYSSTDHANATLQNALNEFRQLLLDVNNRIDETPLGDIKRKLFSSLLLAALVGVPVLVLLFGGFFGFFLVVVPIGIAAGMIASGIHRLRSLLP